MGKWSGEGSVSAHAGEYPHVHEKYSMNLTPPTPKEQNPRQMSKQEESMRMAKAESGSSGLSYAALPGMELTGGRASQTLGLDPSGYSPLATAGGVKSFDTHPHCGASQESSLRGLEFSLDLLHGCIAVFNQCKLNDQVISTK